MYTVVYIAEKIGGRVIGKKEKEISEICSPEDITKDSIVFIKDKRMYDTIEKGIKPLCVVVDFEPDTSTGFDYIVIKTEDEEEAFISCSPSLKRRSLCFMESLKRHLSQGVQRSERM